MPPDGRTDGRTGENGRGPLDLPGRWKVIRHSSNNNRIGGGGTDGSGHNQVPEEATCPT